MEYITLNKKNASAVKHVEYVTTYNREEFTLGNMSESEIKFWRKYGKAFLTKSGDLLVKDSERGLGYPYVEETEETRGIQERLEEGVPFSDREWEEIVRKVKEKSEESK